MIENSNRIQSILSNIIDKVEIIKNDFNENGRSYYEYVLEKLTSAKWDLDLIVDMARIREVSNEKHKIERGFDVNRRINIPKKILDELGIKEDAVMILYVEDNKIILEKKELGWESDNYERNKQITR